MRMIQSIRRKRQSGEGGSPPPGKSRGVAGGFALCNLACHWKCWTEQGSGDEQASGKSAPKVRRFMADWYNEATRCTWGLVPGHCSNSQWSYGNRLRKERCALACPRMEF